MTARAFSRGWPVEWVEAGQRWIWSDTGQPLDIRRVCRQCGQPPTADGYDACLGYLEGVTAACCGHGVTEPVVVEEA